MQYTYPIEKFSFNRLTNTFCVEEKTLLTTTTDNTLYAFPNKRKQFFIESKKISRVIYWMNRDKMVTSFMDEINWFRRFRLKAEDSDFYTFESEDGILCKITKDKDNGTI